MKHVSLEIWAQKNLNPVPSITTLYRWAKAKRFDPPARKFGKQWRVAEDAEYVEPEPSTEVVSDDPVVNAIINQL